MARKKHQHYTEEFRKEAVKRSEETGVTQAQVTKELGISAQQISNWKRQFTRLSDKQFNTVDGVDYSKQESEELQKRIYDYLDTTRAIAWTPTPKHIPLKYFQFLQIVFG